MVGRKVVQNLQALAGFARQHVTSRPAAGFRTRFLSSRTPIPDPKWKQDKNLDDIIPSDMDQATGLERAELLAENEGKNLFDVQPVGAFGTKENPVVVESIYEERIMGCPGGCASGDTTGFNELRWFIVKREKPYVCPECSQVFKLKQVEGDEYRW